MANIDTPRLIVAVALALVARAFVGCTLSTGKNFYAPEPLITKMEATCGQMIIECKEQKDVKK